MNRILMVCKGNICRSPLAQDLLASKASKAHLYWLIDSAGTGNWHIGKLPDQRSIKVAESNDLDITDQRARQFSKDDFSKFDHIYVMEKENQKIVLSMAPSEKDQSKVELIMNELYPGQNLDVPDPFHDGKEQFDQVFKVLNQVTDEMIKKYRVPICDSGIPLIL